MMDEKAQLQLKLKGKIQEKETEIVRLRGKVDTMTTMVPQIIKWKPLAQVYTLFLRKQLLNFQFMQMYLDLTFYLITLR